MHKFYSNLRGFKSARFLGCLDGICYMLEMDFGIDSRLYADDGDGISDGERRNKYSDNNSGCGLSGTWHGDGTNNATAFYLEET